MPDLPGSFAALCGMALVLGARHGIDADHLAAIDALTRLNAGVRPRLAAAAGALFSLGHGVVVLIVALATAALLPAWQVPGWMDAAGAAIAVALLLALAGLNLAAVLRTPRGMPVALRGLRSRGLARLRAVRHPVGVLAIGALFALSFDTFSLAALFALGARQFGGLGAAALTAALFVAAMLVVDGVNGWWIARVVTRADRAAVRASRRMALGVALVSASLAVLVLGAAVLPAVDRWAEDHGVALAATVTLMVFAAARWTSRRAVR